MKRKFILILLSSILLAVFTIAVRAERRSGRIEPTTGHQSGASSLVTRLVSASFISGFLSTRQEEQSLLLEGSIFFLLGLFWLRRARRDAQPLPAQPGGGAD